VTPHPHWAGVKQMQQHRQFRSWSSWLWHYAVFQVDTNGSVAYAVSYYMGTMTRKVVAWSQRRAKSPWPGHKSLSFTPQSKEI